MNNAAKMIANFQMDCTDDERDDVTKHEIYKIKLIFRHKLAHSIDKHLKSRCP